MRAALVAVLVGSFAVPAIAEEQVLPNLVPDPPLNVTIGDADEGGGLAIRFDTRVANLSPNHLDVIGELDTTDIEHPRAMQCVGWAERACVERQEVGRFLFHPQHLHWHIDDYATYELRFLNSDGSINLGDDGLAAPGNKVSFCLIDYEPATDDAQGVLGFGFYYLCEASVQGISAWWADTYTSGLYGQQIELDGVADGTYALVIHANPAGFLHESTLADNVASRIISISGNGTDVTTP